MDTATTDTDAPQKRKQTETETEIKSKSKSKPPEVYAVISFGYHSTVMPLARATELMNCFAHAQKYATEGYGKDSRCYIGGPLPEITMTLLSEGEYTAGVLEGPKEG